EFEIQEFPLPPFAEQHRIVAKVEELMALCDRLEAAKAEREARRDRLTAATLHGLNNGSDGPAFREHAQFALEHLPQLTSRTEQIKQLRQTLLDLALRGRLTAQWRETTEISEGARDYLRSVLSTRKQTWDRKQSSDSNRSYPAPVAFARENLPKIP